MHTEERAVEGLATAVGANAGETLLARLAKGLRKPTDATPARVRQVLKVWLSSNLCPDPVIRFIACEEALTSHNTYRLVQAWHADVGEAQAWLLDQMLFVCMCQCAQIAASSFHDQHGIT